MMAIHKANPSGADAEKARRINKRKDSMITMNREMRIKISRIFIKHSNAA